jgi:hypothetical protein
MKVIKSDPISMKKTLNSEGILTPSKGNDISLVLKAFTMRPQIYINTVLVEFLTEPTDDICFSDLP